MSELSELKIEGFRDCIKAQLRLTGSLGSSFGLLVLLGGDEEHVDVGEDTTSSDGGVAKKLVELVVVADSQLDVAGNDTGLLVVLSGVTGELEDLSGEVLKDGGEVHGGTGTDALSVTTSLKEAGDSADGELKSSL